MDLTTNLDKIKEVAVMLLYQDIHDTEFSPIIVSHPFTNSGVVTLPNNHSGYDMVNIVEDVELLDQWRKYMRNRIDSAEDVMDIYIMLNKPYIFAFIKLCLNHLSKEDLAELWKDAWMRVEFANDDANLSAAEARDIFVKVRDLIMTDDEADELANLPANIKIYRGVTAYNNDRNKLNKAISWTLSRETAEFFAKRWKGVPGFVYECMTDKSHALALLNGRNEHEVILYPYCGSKLTMHCIAKYENK